jgi:class 3 adenylate cyclase
MISNNEIFDEGSDSSDQARDSDPNGLDDFISSTDYDGDSITDYDGTELDLESSHRRQFKTIPPSPPSEQAPGRNTHHIDFDPLALGRDSTHNKIAKASADENSSSGKNSALTFSEKTSGETTSKRKERKKANNSRVKTIVRGETNKIRRWKLASITWVILVGLVCSFLVFWRVYQINRTKYDDTTPTFGDDPLFYKAVFHIEDTANMAFRQSVTSLEVISRALTEYANSNITGINPATTTQSNTFPFVTLPNFQELALDMFGTTDESSNVLFERVFWAPIIDASTKDEWEDYSFDHQGWIMDNGVKEQHNGSISIEEGEEYPDPNDIPVNIASYIHSNLMYHNHVDDDQIWTMTTRFEYSSKPDAEAITSFLPAWQTLHFENPNTNHNHSLYSSDGMLYQMDHNHSQMNHGVDHSDHSAHSGHRRGLEDNHSGDHMGHGDHDSEVDQILSFVNFDLNTWFTPAAAAFKDAPSVLADDDDYSGESQLDGAVHVWNDPPFDDVHREHEHMMDGSNCHMSLFLRVPVYDNLQTQNIAGFVFSLLHEELGFFRDTAQGLSKDLPLILVVKEERNGRQFPTRKRSYEIRGSEITFLGENDRHDDKYSDKVYKFKLRTPNNEDSTSSTVYLLYPTDEFFIYAKLLTAKEDKMISLSQRFPAIEAVWGASLVASVFAVILILFVCYDNSVEERQRKLLRQAERTDAIVGSMFPANIQGRLMMIDDDTIESSKRGMQRQIVDQQEKEKPFPTMLTGFDASNHSVPGHTDGIKASSQLNNSSFHTASDANIMARMGRKHGNGNWNRFHGQTPQLSNETKVDESILRFGNTKPMADFYPNTTILMCDIAGFTAWSSARAPADVFRLLETIYGAFDDIARAEKVFKVETVGDCYVACAGLPVRQPKHAIIMAKFARKTLKRYETLIKKLEMHLGPDTVDLGLRMGIHSGPVTAGVLRGDKTRFQLFGDTVNTASRMESTGRINMIQVSPQTANLLKDEGLGKWVVPRENLVAVKGKGQMQTYWLIRSGSSMSSTISQASAVSPMGSPKIRKGTNSIWKVSGGQRRRNSMGASNASWETSSTGTQSSGSVSSHPQRRHSNNENSARNSKERRLIEWMVETFMKSLKKIAKHRARNPGTYQIDDLDGKELSLPVLDPEAQIIDEIKEVIPIREKESRTSEISLVVSLEGTVDSNDTDHAVSQAVERQLRDYITVVSLLYHDHSFHNFEHCAHVLMSVLKLLSRILESKLNGGDAGLRECGDDHAYGITSDPLLEFSCLFSALIHDVDHCGVPNSQLVKENTTTALRYHNRSVAEQHSIAVAWSLLMQPCYRELRECIYRTETEFDRFRQLVVNSVMATDIMDRELKKFRDNRWEKAFNLKTDFGPVVQWNENTNRMATVVIEHMIQASDVAHTMQHWHVYLKFNERLFKEMYQAYKDGRAEKDPSEYWYEGELNFFKFYIIPLALKLKECGVFGVSGDEYFFHAESNRSEWALKGKEIVAEYMGRLSRNDSRHTRVDSPPTPMRTKQLLKLPEEKSQSFRSSDSLNSMV